SGDGAADDDVSSAVCHPADLGMARAMERVVGRRRTANPAAAANLPGRASSGVRADQSALVTQLSGAGVFVASAVAPLLSCSRSLLTPHALKRREQAVATNA